MPTNQNFRWKVLRAALPCVDMRIKNQLGSTEWRACSHSERVQAVRKPSLCCKILMNGAKSNQSSSHFSRECCLGLIDVVFLWFVSLFWLQTLCHSQKPTPWADKMFIAAMDDAGRHTALSLFFWIQLHRRHRIRLVWLDSLLCLHKGFVQATGFGLG